MGSTQTKLYQNLSYIPEIKEQILLSGGTIVYTKDNIIIATEISEAEYVELLKNPNIYKMDVLPAKRYGYDSNTISYDPYL